MKPQQEASQQNRKCGFDQFEDRIVMTAQPLGDTALAPQIMIPDLSQQGELVQFSNDQFQLDDLRETYNLDGSGQTVAIIDSGIAWDHYALGGGYGAGNKVVGGWDFAENDADPYDSGPAALHGSHVSGIVASEDSQYRGVAPG
ncbi:MAG: S8 family serine peptidase [Pirellulaceae bacterium]